MEHTGTKPNMAGAKIKEYWEADYGHRRKGITCMGDGFTGCHGNYDSIGDTGSINAHGSDSRGLLANYMELPVPVSPSWDKDRYKLCLDCHINYPNVLTVEELVGVADGGNYSNYNPQLYAVDFMKTGFHDYKSFNWSYGQINLHTEHLTSTPTWNYRGQTSTYGLPSCTACHNVHGVSGRDSGRYFLWDEHAFTIVTISGVEYGKYRTGYSFKYTYYPDFCSDSCHRASFPSTDYKYPRSPFNEAKAVASNGTGTPGVLDDGDKVTIYFSDSTTGPAITEDNIDAVLPLSPVAGGHLWKDSNKGGGIGSLTAVWLSTNGKTNNVLTITIYVAGPVPNPTIAIGDKIYLYDYVELNRDTHKYVWAPVTPVFYDLFGNVVRGNMRLTGSF